MSISRRAKIQITSTAVIAILAAVVAWLISGTTEAAARRNLEEIDAAMQRAGSNSVAPAPRISAVQAGAIVARFARERKINLKDYRRPQVEFDPATRQWDFFYTLKLGMPGGHFDIRVDESGAAGFMGGL